MTLGAGNPIAIFDHLDYQVAFMAGNPLPELQERLMEAVRIGLQKITRNTTSEVGIPELHVNYTGDNQISGIPGARISEAYMVRWNSTLIEISSSSISGVVYALGTIAQLAAARGELPAESGEIYDYPQYSHRGMLVDAGRRFWPLPLLKQTVEALSTVKMNVMHLHFTDNCRFAIQSDSHPELTPSDGQYLTKEEVAELINFASVRGVRIIPEIDLPGHARGMRDATGVTWANEDRVQMTDSKGTRNFLKNIFDEFAQFFPEEYFHIGADETSNAPKALIEFVIQLLQSHGKRVIGWEEAFLDSGVDTNLTLQMWKSMKEDVSGFETIYSDYQNFYLDLRPQNRRLWRDINPKKISAFIGGEVAMWTDQYCVLSEGFIAERPVPISSSLFHASEDEKFTESIHRMSWPKSALAASSLWNFVPTMAVPETRLPFMKKFLFKNFGIKGCVDIPGKCRCSENHGCGEDEWEFTEADFPKEEEKISQLTFLISRVREWIPSFQTVEDVLLELFSAPANFCREMYARGEYSGASLFMRRKNRHVTFLDSIGTGMFLTKYASWLGPNPTILDHPRLPEVTGDVSIYYVDGFYTGYAFTSSHLLNPFLLRLRNEIGPKPTVFFIFDDAGKADGVIFAEYVEKFAGWLASLSPEDRPWMGKLGFAVNIESLTMADFTAVVDQVVTPLRSDITKFQVIIYHEEYASHMQLALKVADSLMVHILGSEPKIIAENAIAFLTQNESLFTALNENSVYVTFAVGTAEVQQVGELIWAGIVRIFTPVIRHKYFDRRTLISVHPWETVME